MAAYQLPLQASWRAVRPPKLHVDGAASHTHDGLAVCDRAQTHRLQERHEVRFSGPTEVQIKRPAGQLR